MTQKINVLLSLSERFREQDPSTTSRAQALEAKMKEHFKEKIKLQKGETRSGNLVHSNNATVKESLRNENQLNTKLKNEVKEVALDLRASVQDAKHNLLSIGITLDRIISEKTEILKEVLQFFRHLINGAGNRTSYYSNKIGRIKSTLEGVMYSITSRTKKSSKHVKLGIEYENKAAMEQVINKPVKRRRAFVLFGLDIFLFMCKF